jgi:hypothetical protein
MHVLTSKRVPNTAWGQTVARAIEQQIQTSAASVGDSPFADRHVEGLRNLRDLINNLSGEHPAVYTLWTCQSRGGEDSDGFNPGEEQQSFLSTLGLTGDLDSQLPDAGELLQEFVACGVMDALDRQQALANRRPPEQQAQADAAVREAHDRVEELEEQNAALSAALSSKESDNSALEGALANLKRVALAVQDKVEQPEKRARPKSKSNLRRVKRIKQPAASSKEKD